MELSITDNCYLELLKRCLTDSIYGSTKTRRRAEVGKGWPERAHTMIGLRRLDNIQYCIERILDDNIDGDLIETGVWRGGATIFMRGVLQVYNSTKKVFVADSFEGLPKPNPEKYPADEGDKHYTFKRLSVRKKEVKQNFRAYGLLDDQVIFIPGFFRETLPTAPIEKLSVLRLDGDMYESTWDSLINLYNKLETGGFIIIDDWGLLSCQSAVCDFREAHSINDVMENTDEPRNGVFWRKTQ